MSWGDIVPPLIFVLSVAYLLGISCDFHWITHRLRQSGISGDMLPPRPSFRRRKNVSSTANVSYAPTAFTRERALRSFSRYDTLAGGELSFKYRGLNSLRGRHARIADEVGYGSKLAQLKVAIDTNKRVTDAIARIALLEGGTRIANDTRLTLYGTSRWTDDGPTDLARVVEALKHCVRDWSTDALEERNRVFRPILDVLAQVPAAKRKDTKVLVPGAGLGRLAWEITCMGFEVTANEVSAYMTLPLKMLLSPEATPARNLHSVCPHSSWFSHTRSNDTLFRSSAFPDVLPRIGSDGTRTGTGENEDGSADWHVPGGKFELAELDFLSLVPPNRDKQSYSSQTQDDFSLPSIVAAQPRDRGYDFVVTLFFIDTATNILAYLDQIYALLRPRSSPTSQSQSQPGTWVNLGPLLWPSGAVLEPSLQEVLAMSERVGLHVVGQPPSLSLLGDRQVQADQGQGVNSLEARRTLECQYTANRAGMMKWMYQAEFWVARRWDG